MARRIPNAVLQTGAGLDPVIEAIWDLIAPGEGGGEEPGNSAPTDITVTWRAGFTGGVVPEDTATSTVLADLSATDDAPGVTFSEVADADGKFTVSGTTLVLSASLDYESDTSHSVTIRATDAGGLTYDEVVTITVSNVDDPVTYTEPTVSRPAGGGDVSLSLTSVSDGTNQNPTIALRGDAEDNITSGTTYTRWQHLWAGIGLHQNGRTPTFTLDFADWWGQIVPEANSLYWRPAGGGPDDWQPFDNRGVAGTLLTVSNDTPFAVSEIEVALTPMLSYGEIEDWLVDLDGNANVFRPASATALNVSSTAPNKYAYYDFPDATSPDGIAVGSTYAFCFGITDPVNGPLDASEKRNLFHEWCHAGEQPGLRAMYEFVEFLLSSDATAVALRRDFRHIFYITNTAGLVGGMARGCCDASDIGDDPARVWWNNPTSNSGIADPIPSVDAVCAAIGTDFGIVSGKIDAIGCISWHSFAAPTPKLLAGYPNMMASAAAQAFYTQLATEYGESIYDLVGIVGTGTTPFDFARVATRGLLYNVIEVSAATATFDADMTEIAEAVGRTLKALFDADDLDISTATDPNYANVVLLAGFDGVDGVTAATNEKNGASFTFAADAQIDTSFPTGGTAGALLVDGGGDYVTLPDSDDWAIHSTTSAPFTVELKFRAANTNTGVVQLLVGQWRSTGNQRSWMLAFTNTNGLAFYYSADGATLNNSNVLLTPAAANVAGSTWHALAVDFDGTTTRLYLNGVMRDSFVGTLPAFFASTAPLSIGAQSDGTNTFNGRIKEVRITKGVARYASDSGYTVATEPFPRA